ncbi:MAG: nucleotidyltransferase family protein [Candidatus Acidiferrum sp.]|jgi:putative nucleotidyltransferase-like protein
MLHLRDHGDFYLKASSDQGNSLSAEWLALLECANPHTDVPRLNELFRKPLDWRRLLTLADEHGVLPLLTKHIALLDEGSTPAEVRRELRDAARAQTLFTLSLTAELFRVLDRFAALGIAALLTKGPVLSARCYGDPGLRQYTDLDFVLRDDDVHRATEAMMALSYEPKIPLKAIKATKVPGEYVFVQSGTKLLVEFHTERTFRYHPKPLSVDKLFQRQALVRFDGHDVPALSNEDELILICIHGAKHFWERLMWIADVAALVSRQTIDWNRAMAAAREVQAERMLRVGLLLAANMLGARLPAELLDRFRADAAVSRMAAQIARRLPVVESEPFGLLGRAAFRVRMRGGFLPGVAYLLRLSLSPTEEDWVAGAEEKRPSMLDAITRPFRLARKYGRNDRL